MSFFTCQVDDFGTEFCPGSGRECRAGRSERRWRYGKRFAQAALSGHQSVPLSQGHGAGPAARQAGTLKLGAAATLPKVTWPMTGPDRNTRALTLVFLTSTPALTTTTLGLLSRERPGNTYEEP